MSRSKVVLISVLTLALSGLSQISAQALGEPADITAPLLTSYTVVSPSVDVTRGPQTAFLVLRIADAVGFSTGSVMLSTTGGATLEGVIEGGNRVSGTAKDGTYNVPVFLEQGFPGGDYRVSAITLSDEAENEGLYGPTNPLVSGAVLAVTRTPGGVDPVLVGRISASAATVDTTNAAREVLYSADLEDSVPGVATAVLTLTRPPSPEDPPETSLTFDVELLLATGTANRGTWTAGRSYLPGQDRFTWTPTALTLTDGYGASTTRLISADGGDVVTVTGSEDITPPTLVGVTTPVATVDTTKTEKTITVAAHITDDVSGFSSGSLTWTTPDGLGGFHEVSGMTADRTDGNALDGTYDVALTFPARSKDGVWTLTSASLSDQYLNSTDPTAEDAGLSGSTSTITVRTDPDSEGPALEAFALGPDTVSTAYEGGQVFGHLTATDDVSGIASAQVTFRHPSGAEASNVVTALSMFDASEGSTPERATFHFSVDIPDTASAGAWTVAKIVLTDVAEKERTITPAGLEVGEQGFTVVSTVGDAIAPTLSALSVNPTLVDTRTGDKTVALTLTASDSGTVPSGMSHLIMELTAPTTGQSVSAFVTTGDLISGDSVSGTYRTTVTLPKHSESGPWVVSQVEMTDRADNARHLLQGDLAGLDLTTTLSVTGASDTINPVLTGLTLETPTIDTAATSSVQFKATGTDNSSGISSIEVTLTGPGGQTATGEGVDFTSGSEEPVWDVSVNVPSFNSAGDWSTSEVSVTDGQRNTRIYTASELSSLGFSRMARVTAATDNVAPVLAGLRITPTSVDSTDGEVAADVLVHVTDAVSGVAGVELSVTSPNAVQSLQATPGFLTGDESDGWYQGTLTFPRYVDPGTWTVGPVVVSDNAGNTLTRTSAQLAEAFPPGTLTVSGAIDVVSPNLTSLTVTPSSVDTTTGDKTLTVSLGVSDSESGAGSVSLRVLSPTGIPETITTSLDTGTTAAGVWRGTIELPAYSEVGPWTFDQVSLRDIYGNPRTYTHAQLVGAGVGVATGFTVTGTPDVTGPALTGLTLTPSAVDVSAGAVSITGTLTATDAQSGVSGASFTYTSPNGIRTVEASVDPSGRTAGTVTNPTMPFALQMPRFAQAGSWALSAVDLFDRAGNSTSYPPSTLPVGVTTAIQVTDTNEDITPPTVVTVTPTPALLDVRATSGTLTVDVEVTDERSGVARGEVELTSPSGDVTRFASWNAGNRLAGGTAADGVYRVSFPFSTATESGLWSISLPEVTDVAGNSTSYSGVSVPGVRQVQITGTAVAPAAPTNVEAFSGNTEVSLSWDPPSNGGSPITSYTVTPSRNGVAQAPINGIAGTFTAVTGLDNGASYTFVVRAINSAGTGPGSAPSAAVVPAPTTPYAPTITSAIAGNGRVVLDWTAPTNDGGSAVTGYRVTTFSADGIPIATLDIGNVLTHQITGLTNGTDYFFTVKAINTLGAGDPAFTDLLTPTAAPTAPLAPSVVTSSLSSPTSATVTWTPPANGGSAITGYVVTALIGGVEQPLTATAGGADTQATLVGLAKGTAYTFKVRARNLIGAGPQSAASNVVTIPATAPGVPAGVVGTAGIGQVSLTWTAPADVGGSALTGYVVTPYVGGVARPTTPGGTGTSALVTGLAPGTVYTFTVRAANGIGAGAESVASAPVTPTAPSVPVTPASVPGAGGAPAAVAGNASARVTWTAPAVTGGAAINGYVVTPYRSGVAQTPVPVGNILTTVVPSLTNGSAYTFSVRAVNSVGAGAESSRSGVVIPLVPTRVVITKAPALSTYRTAIKVVGKLTRTDSGAALAGQAVQLQVRKKGSTGAFSRVATATSTSAGVVTFTTYKPLTGVQLRLVRPVVAGNGFGTSTSSRKVVSCQMKITANLSALSIARGRSVTLSGVVAPSHRGKAIFLQRKSGTRWVAVTSKVLTRTSGYSFVIKPTARGTFSYRVMMKADATYAVSYGVAKALRVR